MHTGTVAEVERILRRYFAAIYVEWQTNRLSPELATELWLSALFDLQLFRIFLAAVVTRNRVERRDL